MNNLNKLCIHFSEQIFSLCLAAEKCDTNLDYLEFLEALINQNQEIMYWFSLLSTQKLMAQEDYQSLERSAEDIKFIAHSTIKKIHEHLENVMNGFYE